MENIHTRSIDRRYGLCIAAAIVLFGSVSALAADFPTVVALILYSQTDNRISRMDPARKQAMIDCVNQVLAKLPNGKKRFVVEGVSLDEQQDRFGDVVKENRAEWEQKIARSCASIAVGRGGVGHQ